jgi:RNA polymerase sigma-70 factor (ECF subfamily)
MSRRALHDSIEEERWSEWMVRAQAGDQLAYEKLMIEIGDTIERFVLRRFGRGPAGDLVEECVQESLLAVHRARHTYDPARRFRPWLLTIVRHKAIDLLRRDRTRRQEPLDTAELRSREDRTFDDPQHQLDAATVLERLDPKYRTALILTKLEGCSMEEAAGRAGVSVTAMKTRVHRAIRSLQRHFLDEGIE